MSEQNAIPAQEEKLVEYRDIPGYPGYRAGSDGTIWSSRTQGRSTKLSPWKRLKPAATQLGYKRINLLKNGVVKQFSVHRLVLSSFVPPPSEGLHCCHNNSNPADNRLENLRWDTAKGNHSDRLLAGTLCRGDRSGSVKLTDRMVVDIRESYAASPEPTEAIAIKYGVSKETIKGIIQGTRRRYTGGPISKVDESFGLRLGGLKGGPARAAKLSPERRREIGRMGAEATKRHFAEKRRLKLDAMSKTDNT